MNFASLIAGKIIVHLQMQLPMAMRNGTKSLVVAQLGLSTFRYSIISLFLFSSLVAQSSEEGAWQRNMTSMGQIMGELLPELYSKNSNEEVLKKSSRALSVISHKLKESKMNEKGGPPSDLDPTVSFLADRFSEQALIAYKALSNHQVDYGKSLLRSLTAYCIACHTRHKNGPEFLSFPLDPKTEKLSKQEKADLFIATRQFEKGLEGYKSLIGDGEFMAKQIFEWEKTIKNALEVGVRVKNDSSLALEIVNKALSVPNIPEFERDGLLKWKVAIEKWKKEPEKKLVTEVGLASEMKRVYAEAKRNQEYLLDKSAQIQYLRASALAHELLQVSKNPKLKAEAFFTAGTAYQVLGNSIFSPLHETYYEACIREYPHSSVATQCFHRFQESIYFGYTSNEFGTEIPQEIKTRLAELKTLASEQREKTPSKK